MHYMALSLSKYVNRAAMMRGVGGFLVTHFKTCIVTVTVTLQVCKMGVARKMNIPYMALSLSKYVNRAVMMREAGGFLVTHSADLQRYSRKSLSHSKK